MKQMKKGFTLIELLIVIAIIGLLATLAIVSMSTASQKGRDAKRLSDLTSVRNALELYYNDNAAYPIPIQNYDWPGVVGTALAPYITAMPTDPNDKKAKTNGYLYVVDTTGSKYYLQAVLEDEKHQALTQDIDSMQFDSEVWVSIFSNTSSGTFTESVENSNPAPDCSDTKGNYCLASLGQ